MFKTKLLLRVQGYAKNYEDFQEILLDILYIMYIVQYTLYSILYMLYCMYTVHCTGLRIKSCEIEFLVKSSKHIYIDEYILQFPELYLNYSTAVLG